MFSFLKNHPFAVEAFFKSSLVLTFAVKKEQLQNLIPECLELDTLNNEWAFIAVAMVETTALRPKGFPNFLGNDFFLIGYRVFVKYTNSLGKKFRGLYILKSETDKKLMEFLGNIFTHYSYATTDIKLSRDNDILTINSCRSDFKVVARYGDEEILLPTGSPFTDWHQARKFAGPLPFTFTYNTGTQQILIIEGVRQNWTPAPVKVIDYHIPFLTSLQLRGVVLANAFIIHNIPYYWKKGVTEQWKG